MDPILNTTKDFENWTKRETLSKSQTSYYMKHPQDTPEQRGKSFESKTDCETTTKRTFSLLKVEPFGSVVQDKNINMIYRI